MLLKRRIDTSTFRHQRVSLGSSSITEIASLSFVWLICLVHNVLKPKITLFYHKVTFSCFSCSARRSGESILHGVLHVLHGLFFSVQIFEKKVISYAHSEKILQRVLHHTSFFTAEFKCSPGCTNIVHGFGRGFSFQILSLGVTTLHVTSVLYQNWVCSLNFQALPLQPLVSEKQCKRLDQAWSWMTTSHITPVHPSLNCG